MAIVGDWYQSKNGSLYVYINKQGTVYKIQHPKNLDILYLAIMNFFNKRLHKEDVLILFRIGFLKYMKYKRNVKNGL